MNDLMLILVWTVIGAVVYILFCNEIQYVWSYLKFIKRSYGGVVRDLRDMETTAKKIDQRKDRKAYFKNYLFNGRSKKVWPAVKTAWNDHVLRNPKRDYPQLPCGRSAVASLYPEENLQAGEGVKVVMRFSDKSAALLRTCHPDLQKLFEHVLQIHDCTVTAGHRGEEEQNEAFRTGKSKLQFPNSKHNSTPSRAVDVIPWPVDWNDQKRFYYFIGIVKGVAAKLNIKIRTGADWDGDNDFKDQNFNDMPHFELLD